MSILIEEQRNAFFKQMSGQGQFTPVFDCVPDTLVFIKDCDSKLIYCNQTMLKILRCSHIDEIFGKTGTDFFPDSLASPYLLDDKKVVQSGKALREIVELNLQENGELSWYNTNKFPLMNDSGEVIGLMGISQRLAKADQKLHPAANILPALQEIQKNYSQDITIDELAQKSFLSVSQFYRSFKQHFRQTPLQFLLRVRIQASCKLLRSTSLSVAKIADKCGFSEQNYFARHFKQVLGQSPTQFRKKYQ